MQIDQLHGGSKCKTEDALNKKVRQAGTSYIADLLGIVDCAFTEQDLAQTALIRNHCRCIVWPSVARLEIYQTNVHPQSRMELPTLHTNLGTIDIPFCVDRLH